MHAAQNIYLHNIVDTCPKEGLNKENTTQIEKYNKHNDLIPWKLVEIYMKNPCYDLPSR